MVREKLQVLQLGKLYYPITGGIEKTMQQIAEGIRGDVNSYVLVAQPKGKAHKEIVNGVSVYYAASMGTIASLPISPGLVFYLCKNAKKFDIIHLHMPFPLGDLACLLSRFKGKLIVYWHSDIVRQKKMMVFYRPLMDAILRRADVIAIATQGNINGSAYVRPYRDKCVVIPFGLAKSIENKSDAYWMTKKSDTKKEGSKLKLLFIGRLVYYKGCDILIKALMLLMDDDINLTIIGSGVLEEGLKQLVIGEHMEEQIHFAGYVGDEKLMKYIEECDVFVFPSVANSEAFGLVQMEAMVYGKPIINTSLPTGVPYVSIHGQTGLTVKPGDIDALSYAIQWMKEHPEERKTMGDRARIKVKKEFTEELLIQRILKLYRGIV